MNGYGAADPNNQFDKCVNGDYEPGSVFKLQTIAMALDSGMIHYWDYFDTSHPLKVGRFTITDFEPVHVWMAVPQILNVSSNIGASRIATILGPKIEQAWYAKQGFFKPLDIELPGPPAPELPPINNWGLAATMTVSFGNGIAVSPLHLITGVVPIVNGGIRYNPTLVAVDPNGPQPVGVRVMQQSTSDLMQMCIRDRHCALRHECGSVFDPSPGLVALRRAVRSVPEEWPSSTVKGVDRTRLIDRLDIFLVFVGGTEAGTKQKH